MSENVWEGKFKLLERRAWIEGTRYAIVNRPLRLVVEVSGASAKVWAAWLLKRVNAASPEEVDKQGFHQGLALAVAHLLRQGQDTHAEELWKMEFNDNANVPKYIDGYDARPIRKAIKTNWGRA